MLSNRYGKSRCKKEGWLHDFKIIEQRNNGLVERCKKCGQTEFFPMNIPNHEYLKYHIRNILTMRDQLFFHEYPNIKQ